MRTEEHSGYWHWQDLPGWVLYSILSMFYLIFSLRYRMTPLDLVHANPGLPYGGMQVASKFEIHELIRGKPGFLNQLFVPEPTEANIGVETLAQQDLRFPLILKPDQSSSGVGVQCLQSEAELIQALKGCSQAQVVQEYCDYREEFGVFYMRLPMAASGEVISLTHKQIPFVTGDGRSTIRELVLQHPEFTKAEKQKMLRNCRVQHQVPAMGIDQQVILQGSHAKGARFINLNSSISESLNDWVDESIGSIPGFHFGRLDVKAASVEDLIRGERLSIIEINGAMSEPIHVYDDTTSFREGMRTFFHFNKQAFSIAAHNRRQLRKIPRKTRRQLILAFVRFFSARRQLKQQEQASF